MGNYVLAITAQSDKNNLSQVPGTINGGFFEFKDDELNRIPHIVISVEDIHASMQAVTKSGGRIIGALMEIPGIGTYASFRDTEDNLVGMLQPQGM